MNSQLCFSPFEYTLPFSSILRVIRENFNRRERFVPLYRLQLSNLARCRIWALDEVIRSVENANF